MSIQTNLNSILEIIAVVTAIAYVVLAARENVWCWIFGIVSSSLSIYITFIAGLHGQAVLYIYYVVMGMYGWYLWRKPANEESRLTMHWWTLRTHGFAIGIGAVCTILAYLILQNFSANEYLLLDCFTAVYSIIATYMLTKKVMENWIYWMVVDFASLLLYVSQDFIFYSFLFAIYMIISIYGFINWRKEYYKYAS